MQFISEISNFNRKGRCQIAYATPKRTLEMLSTDFNLQIFKTHFFPFNGYQTWPENCKRLNNP